MAAEGTLHAKEERRLNLQAGERVDYPFLFLILLLLTVGLAMLYSASYAQSQYDTSYAISTKYLQKQAVCAAIGLAAMYAFSRIPAAFWYRLAWPVYALSIVLLLSVLVIGEEVNGARRWINLAGIQFQPSEIAKFTMIVLFARLTRGFGQRAKDFRFGVLGFGMALMGILVPLALEKHLSAIMLMGMVFNTANSYFIGAWLFRYAPAGTYTAEWLASPQFIIGTLVFFTGMLINLSGAWNSALILVSFAAGLAAIIYAEKSLKEVRT